MISTEDIERLKANSAWIITLAIWHKWQLNGTVQPIGRTKQALGCVPVYRVQNKTVKSDWLLTYAHRQYIRLILVDAKDIE